MSSMTNLIGGISGGALTAALLKKSKSKNAAAGDSSPLAKADTANRDALEAGDAMRSSEDQEGHDLQLADGGYVHGTYGGCHGVMPERNHKK